MTSELNDQETIEYYLLNPKDDDFGYIEGCDAEYVQLIENKLDSAIALAEFQRKYVF